MKKRDELLKDPSWGVENFPKPSRPPKKEVPGDSQVQKEQARAISSSASSSAAPTTPPIKRAKSAQLETSMREQILLEMSVGPKAGMWEAADNFFTSS